MKESSSILTFLKKIIRRIRTFFRSILSKEVLIFLIFLLISCFFWVLQSLQEISEIEMSFPVSYTEMPANIYITNKLPNSVKVTLRDKGSNLYYYYRHRKEFTIHVNLMEWYHKDSIGKVPLSSFDSFLRNRMKPTTQILLYQPDNIFVYFASKASKEVPVHLKSKLSLSVQHIFSDEPVVIPAKINVYAPASVLAKLNEVETELLALDNLGDSTVATVRLVPIEGVLFSAKTVKVKLNVEEFTEQSLMIPVTGLNFPGGEYLLSFPSSVKVTFFVGISAYTKISEKDFVISVDRTNLMHSEKRSQKVMLNKSPANVQNIRIQPEMVDCLIEKK